MRKNDKTLRWRKPVSDRKKEIIVSQNQHATMTDLNLIITKPEELKTLLFQWLDEHHESRGKKNGPIRNNDQLLSRSELAEYFKVSTVTWTCNEECRTKNNYTYLITYHDQIRCFFH